MNNIDISKSSNILMNEYSIDNYMKKTDVELCYELIRIYDNNIITTQNILRFIKLGDDILKRVDNRKIREKIKKLMYYYILKNQDKILKLKEYKNIKISENKKTKV